MFGFFNKKKLSSYVKAPIINEFDRLSSKCKTLDIGTAKFLIPVDLGSLSDVECDLLYRSWKTEYTKTSLMSNIMNRELSYFQNTNPTDRPKLQKLFESLNIEELTISIDYREDADPYVLIYKNDMSTSGLSIKYRVYGPYSDEIEIKNSDNAVVLDVYIDNYTRIREHGDNQTLRKIIPGNWMSDMSSSLTKVQVFEEEEDLRWHENLASERAAEKRSLISEAMDLN